MHIAVVGASGFVGRALIQALLEHTEHRISALSRTPLAVKHPQAQDRYQAVRCDLHNLLDLEEALTGVDIAFYLVHSMLPGARLNQGTFADFDLSLADNFARTAKLRGVSHVIYLSGLIPDEERLSDHLRSRLEVEKTLRFYLPYVTCLRTGMIIGSQGSSFTMMVRLVQRLPLMVCPGWTQNRCQVVALDDVVRCLIRCVEDPSHKGKTYDVGAEPPISYREMLAETARLLGKKRLLINFPFFTIGLSKLWVRLVTGAPKDLVYPLINSLAESMLVRKDHAWPEKESAFKTFRVAAQENLKAVLQSAEQPHAFRGSRVKRESTVRSIQRLPLPKGKDAKWLASQYLAYLPALFMFIIRVDEKDDHFLIRLRLFKITLLVLAYSRDRSTPDRQLFYVRGGLLCSRKNRRGRLELRETLGGTACLAAVHDFRPSLPWVIYRWTQAEIHKWFMYRLGQHIATQSFERGV